MEERKASTMISGSFGLTHLDQLELRIKVLEQEIPFYSNKAAEAMVQGVEDNTFKVETEKRLEELTRTKDELRKLQAEKKAAQEAAIPPPPQPSPPLATASLGAVLPTSSPPASVAQANSRMPQRMSSLPGSQPAPQHGPPQPQLTRKQTAVLAAENRVRSTNIQDCVFLCSVFLEYHDLTASACVNKYWRNRVRKTPGWRRVVLNLEYTLHGHVGRISALATYESLIVTGSTDGKIKFWDPAKTFVCVKTLNITPSPVHKYVHPKLREIREQRIASGYGTSEEEEFAEYPLAVTSLLTVDKCVLIGAEDGRFIVWMASTHEKKEFDTTIHSKAISCIVLGGEDFIFTASLDGKIAAINRRGFPFNPQAPAVWQTPQYGSKKHETGVTALAVAGGHLFSGAMDGKIYVWQPKGMEFRKTLSHNRGLDSNGLTVVIEHNDRITSMAGFMDRLYTASWDGTVKLWNARCLECLRDVPVLPLGICWSLAIRRDPLSRITTLVGGVRDSDICIMDWETLEVMSTCEQNNWAYKLDQHTHWVRCIMAFSEGRIVTGSDDWTAKVWHIRGSSQRPQSLFMGLPPGPLSQEDCEIIMSQMLRRAGQQLSMEQLQEQKMQHDKIWKEKMAHSSSDQIAMHETYFNKAAEGWTKAREKRRKDAMLAAGGAGSGNSNAASTAVGKTSPPAPSVGIPPSPSPSVSTAGLNSTAVASASNTNGNPTPLASPRASENEANGQAPSESGGNGEVPEVKKEPVENGTHAELLASSSPSELRADSPKSASGDGDTAMGTDPPPSSDAAAAAPDSAEETTAENGDSEKVVAADEEQEGEDEEGEDYESGSEDKGDGVPRAKRRKTK
jgi:WD40 repeat protein